MRTVHGRRVVFALAFVVALVAGACAQDEPAQKAETDDVEGVTITAGEYSFDVPSRIEASTVDFRFVNDGEFAHEAVFVKLGDESREEFFTDFDALVEADFSGPLPEGLFNGTQQVGEIQPGEDTITTNATMTSGNWLLFCALTDADTEGEDEGGEENGEQAKGEEQPKPHYRLGMFTEIEVTGDEEPEVPTGDTTVTIRDYTFEAELEAGEQTLAAVNEGPDQLHHIVAFDSGEGVDPSRAEADFKAGLAEEDDEENGAENGAEGGPGEPDGKEEEAEEGEPEEAFFTGVMSPGYGQTVEADLESGHTYVFACFISDRTGGAPHAVAHDMVKAFAVP